MHNSLIQFSLLMKIFRHLCLFPALLFLTFLTACTAEDRRAAQEHVRQLADEAVRELSASAGKELERAADALERAGEAAAGYAADAGGEVWAALQPEEGGRLELPAVRDVEAENILQRKGFTLSYNAERGVPNWVAWELNAEKLADRVSRAAHFYPDPDLPPAQAVETLDYSNSGWDRGHMCPAADNKWDAQAMRESFYMTNICPQHHNLNRGDWKELEDNCRRWVEETGGPVYIACGPVFYGKAAPRFIGKEHRVQVPDAFFKVVLAGLAEGRPRAVGFLFKNTSGNRRLDSYVNTVDEVERITGYDFFAALPDSVEQRVEAAYRLSDWK